MEDSAIVALYWARDEDAVRASDEKYGAYCAAIAQNIVQSAEDARECVSDTWLRAWEAIPPERPTALRAFFGAITRNLALNRYVSARAEKRGGGAFDAALDELSEVVSGAESAEDALNARELARTLDGFLSSLPRRTRRMFVCRYWYADSVGDIARRFGKSENSVSVTLHRTREKLRIYLRERGYDV